MHKIIILEKHCTTSKDGRVALSNTLVETAIKLHNCPIRVTCSDYPGEESIYSVSELTSPVPTSGPYPDSFRPGNTYSLLHFLWKGTPIKETVEEIVETSDEDSAVSTTISTITRNSRGTYTIKTPVIVTTYEETEVTLVGYIGAVIKAKRKSLDLNMNQLARLTNGNCSPATISKLEMGDANTSLGILEAICDALDLHISDLFPPKNG